MSISYNIKSAHRIKISQMLVGDVGYVGGGNWHRTRTGFYTASDRWLNAESETFVVRIEKTVSGLVCTPIPYMLNLELEKASDLPSGMVKFTVRQFSYCQREIEEQTKCRLQCDHCKEYYKPLES